MPARFAMGSRAGAAVAMFVLAAGIAVATPKVAASAASPSPAPGPATVIGLILRDNPGLDSYKAHAHLDIRQVNFPWLHPVLDGSQYYTKPGYVIYDFPHTPGYLKGITKVTGSVGLANRWERCYNISVSSDKEVYNLKMTPKIRGEVREMDVVVDRNDGTVHHIDWWYQDPGDHVTLDQFYGFVSGYKVVTLQQSTIQLHHIHAIGNQTFDSFQFNVPVPAPTATPSDPLHACDN